MIGNLIASLMWMLEMMGEAHVQGATPDPDALRAWKS